MSAPDREHVSDVADQRGCIALVGDVHSSWSAEDVAYFNGSAYELVYVVGDLGGSQARDGLSVARSLAGLTRPTLVMPGNNDVLEHARIAAELTYRRGRLELLSDPGTDPTGRAPAEVRSFGYSSHGMQLGSLELTLIAGRPFSMGGPELAFADALERSFGVRTLEQSRERLCALVDGAPTDQLIFLAHNGPTGLGDRPDDPWGRDFHPDAGDWGDRDLRDAIEHARARGKQTRAVLAGHMHWRLRDGGVRRAWVERDGIVYVNSARVPRIFDQGARRLRQHVSLRVTQDRVDVAEVLVPDAGPPLAED